MRLLLLNWTLLAMAATGVGCAPPVDEYTTISLQLTESPDLITEVKVCYEAVERVGASYGMTPYQGHTPPPPSSVPRKFIPLDEEKLYVRNEHIAAEVQISPDGQLSIALTLDRANLGWPRKRQYLRFRSDLLSAITGTIPCERLQVQSNIYKFEACATDA